MIKLRNPGWHSLKDEFSKPYFKELIIRVDAEKQNNKIVIPFPYKELALRSLEYCDPNNIKVIIIGQDPYPNLRDATGLAFSVSNTSDVPQSLVNIFRELKSDLRIDNLSKGYGDLTYWAAQGVLLLNTVLTTNEGESSAHKGFGWEVFTDRVLELVCQDSKPKVYLLMGKDAQDKKKLIIKRSKNKYTIIETPHPSSQSAHTGFYFSKPFSRINDALIKFGLKQIDWRL